MPRWEYKTVKLAADAGGWLSMGGEVDVEKLNATLNQLGSEGWEVISALGTNQGYGASRDVIIILKRPKQ